MLWSWLQHLVISNLLCFSFQSGLHFLPREGNINKCQVKDEWENVKQDCLCFKYFAAFLPFQNKHSCKHFAIQESIVEDNCCGMRKSRFGSPYGWNIEDDVDTFPDKDTSMFEEYLGSSYQSSRKQECILMKTKPLIYKLISHSSNLSRSQHGKFFLCFQLKPLNPGLKSI